MGGTHRRVQRQISIHVLREEDDGNGIQPEAGQQRFLSTSSARRTTGAFFMLSTRSHRFLSTSSARRTTLSCLPCYDFHGISIHVLREEDDDASSPKLATFLISIHVLREEDDCPGNHAQRRWGQFLSTSSARRTTDIR